MILQISNRKLRQVLDQFCEIEINLRLLISSYVDHQNLQHFNRIFTLLEGITICSQFIYARESSCKVLLLSLSWKTVQTQSLRTSNWCSCTSFVISSSDDHVEVKTVKVSFAVVQALDFDSNFFSHLDSFCPYGISHRSVSDLNW